jgi:hypothetical protein
MKGVGIYQTGIRLVASSSKYQMKDLAALLLEKELADAVHK